LDAVKLQITELGKRWLVPALILGPGTALIIAIGALPFGLLLNFGWILAFIGGAVLASTDPVVLRDIVRDERIPRSVRQVLKIEAGMNDLVVLPVVLVLIAVATDQGSGIGGWSVFLVKLLLLGPAIGFAVGGAGSWVMSWMDRKMTIQSEHQSLYGVGLVLASYTAATAAGGDGFLGAFAAGLAVVMLNHRSATVSWNTAKSPLRWLCSWPLCCSGWCSPVYWRRSTLCRRWVWRRWWCSPSARRCWE
jgi:NhaP-type Na+/H+ or K+/H+ antiporter